MITNDEQRREVTEGVPPFSVRPQRDGSFLVWDNEKDEIAYPYSLTRVDAFHVMRLLNQRWRAGRDIIPSQSHERRGEG